jgi:carbonic anhydrase/acetyltransferase-like protein (isoleucine patch superfamily)
MYRFIGNRCQNIGNKLIRLGESLIPKSELSAQVQKAIQISPNSQSFTSAAFVAPNAHINGQVTIGQQSSLWYNTSIHSDLPISIGSHSSIGDGSVVKATSVPTSIGNRVTIGANTELNGCTIEDECIIGDNVKILNGAVIRKHSIIASGTVINENQEVSGENLWAGVPAKIVRNLLFNDISEIIMKANNQIEIAVEHKTEFSLSDEEVINKEIWWTEQAARDPDSDQFKPFSQINTEVDDLSEYGRGVVAPRVFITDFEKKDLLTEK